MTVEISELRVLLVEPSGAQRRFIEREFQALGVADIKVSATGEEALAMMHRQHPELVVSAMYLPDMNGTELVILMRESVDLEDTAFMLVSSETDETRLETIRQAGAVAILPKPFLARNLERALLATLHYYEPGELTLSSEDIEEVRVLIVDDSRMARNHICRVLGKMGMQHFTEVENGREAVAAMQAHFFDLVITDYNMPEMDGNQLVSYIRGHSTQSDIPILMVTSENQGNRLAAVKQAGVSAICDKPFEPAMVRSLLQGMLN